VILCSKNSLDQLECFGENVKKRLRIFLEYLDLFSEIVRGFVPAIRASPQVCGDTRYVKNSVVCNFAAKIVGIIRQFRRGKSFVHSIMQKHRNNIRLDGLSAKNLVIQFAPNFIFTTSSIRRLL